VGRADPRWRGGALYQARRWSTPSLSWARGQSRVHFACSFHLRRTEAQYHFGALWDEGALWGEPPELSRDPGSNCCGLFGALLRKFGLGLPTATLLIANWAEQGQNYLVTIAAGLGAEPVCRGRSVMSVLLLVLGILVAAAGVVAIGFGIPLNEFTLGTTLISGGATALTGGFVLIGLSAVVAELARLADGLGKPSARSPQRSNGLGPAVPGFPATPVPPPVAVPAPRQPASAMPMPPRPRPEAPIRDVSGRDAPSRGDVRPSPSHQPSPSSVDVSAAAIERLRSTIPRTEPPRVEAPPAGYAEEATLSPNGGASPYTPPGRARPEPEAPEPRVAPDERAGGAVEALKASRLDFLFRSKAARPAQQAESFESIWPADARPDRNAAPGAAPAAAPEATPHAADKPSSGAPPAQDFHPPPAAVETPSSPTILKSGVVDGMAYTLYTDGSIEAKLPEGTIRFGSVAELRAHIESGS
jgi:hypothetical protein